jgi:membrane glycosyltransferase
MAAGMSVRSPLEDPHTAAHAWQRFRRLMKLMVGITTLVVTLAMIQIYRLNGLESIHLYIATALGVGVSMLLTSVLMGLVFLSSGTGHDESAAPRNRPDDQPDA